MIGAQLELHPELVYVSKVRCIYGIRFQRPLGEYFAPIIFETDPARVFLLGERSGM